MVLMYVSKSLDQMLLVFVKENIGQHKMYLRLVWFRHEIHICYIWVGRNNIWCEDYKGCTYTRGSITDTWVGGYMANM